MEAGMVPWWRFFVRGITVLLLSVCTVIILYVVYISWIYWKYSHIPSPKKSFLLGHIPYLKKNMQPLHELYFQWYSEVGPIYVIFFIVHTFVIILNPEDIKVLFSDEYNGKPENITSYFKYVCGQRFLGNGILTQTDPSSWKARRRAYDSAFKKSFLLTRVPQMNSCANVMIKKLHNLARTSTGLIPVKQLIQEHCLNVITSVCFSSYDCGPESSMNNPNFSADNLISTMSTVLKGLQNTLRLPIGYAILHPFKARKYRAAICHLRQLGRQLVEKRLKEYGSESGTPRDMLSFILDYAISSGKLTVEDIVDDFSSFYAAGQETTGTLLCFAIILLHQNPSVLQRLLNEVEAVMGVNDEVITADQLDKLVYMEQVFMETLRIYPPLTSFFREAPKGGVVLGGYHIPEKSLVAMVTSVVSRMPEHFPSPEIFNPDRFDKYSGRTCSRYVCFPYGVGKRVCIGKQFAMMEAKVTLAKLLKNFSFQLPPDYELKIESHVILQPQGNLLLKVTCKN